MVLPDSTFPPHIQSRIPTYGAHWHHTVDPNGSSFFTRINASKPVPGKPQAIPIPGTERPGFSAAYRNADGPDELVTVLHPKLQTADDLFRNTVTSTPNNLALGERRFDQTTKTWGPYIYQTYAEVEERVSNLASGIINIVEKHTGQNPFKEQYTVGIYGPNSRNYVIADFACNRTALTPVSLYDTLGPDSTKYIVNLTKTPIIFASLAHIPYLLSHKKDLPTVKAIVSLNDLDDPEYYEHPGHSKRDVLNTWAESVGVSLYSFAEVEENGKHVPREHRKPTPQDIFTINFTSGTTGNPKGVLLNHANVAAGATIIRFIHIFSKDPMEDAFLSFLPLAHIYERLNIHALFSAGVKIGFFRGDMTKVFEDIKELEPTFVCGVPRIWNKMAVAIKTQTLEAPGKLGEVSREAWAAKLKNLKETGEVSHPKYDKLWSDDVRKSFGLSKAKILTSGSAPIAKDNIDFIKCALGVHFAEGYGLTETTSGVCIVNIHDNHSGSVGPINITSEVCLRDLPEFGYSIHDKPYPRGEIMIRGPHVFQGYYKNPEETAKALTEDGWFHSGDVGQIDDMGRIYIIDRVKNMFKLAQGEYVAPERLEALYSSASSLVSQIFVDGNSLETFLVAVVGVTPEVFVHLLKEQFNADVSPTDLEKVKSYFKRTDVRKAVLKRINKEVSNSGLKGFEYVKNLELFIEPLSPTNGTLTPTLKLKRPDCRRYYNSVTSELYNEGPLLDSKKQSKI